jgi:hypothetical protein
MVTCHWTLNAEAPKSNALLIVPMKCAVFHEDKR